MLAHIGIIITREKQHFVVQLGFARNLLELRIVSKFGRTAGFLDKGLVPRDAEKFAPERACLGRFHNKTPRLNDARTSSHAEFGTTTH